MEVIKLSDQLIAYCDDTKLIIKIGRALKFGESRIKLYLLRPNDDEVFLHCDFTFLIILNFSCNQIYFTSAYANICVPFDDCIVKLLLPIMSFFQSFTLLLIT